MSESYDVVDLPERPYLGVGDTVTMRQIPAVADRIPGLVARASEEGDGRVGPPFLRYLVIDRERELRVEAGVQVHADLASGTLPAGRYATTTYTGHPRGLVDATARLLAWADRQGLVWARTDGPDGEHWGCRLEVMLTDPRVHPDPETWQTRLEFLLEG